MTSALRAVCCAALLLVLPACAHPPAPEPAQTADLSQLFLPPTDRVHCVQAVTGRWWCSDGGNQPAVLR
jgi:hypothetical protein